MPRARNIKYSFFVNDDLAEIEPIGRLFFIGLWTIADYKGELEWRPKKIKAELLPYDNCDIKKIAINLDNSGFIRFYSDGNLIYLKIVNFCAHQNPHKNEREKGSSIPEYHETMRQAIDLKGLTINRDNIETNRDENGTARADSCILIPDSLSLIPEKHLSNSDELNELFDTFWDHYPRKENKKKSQTAFNRLSNQKQQQAIIDCKTRFSNTEKRFIPLATTYIHGERWNDEKTEKKSEYPPGFDPSRDCRPQESEDACRQRAWRTVK